MTAAAAPEPAEPAAPEPAEAAAPEAADAAEDDPFPIASKTSYCAKHTSTSTRKQAQDAKTLLREKAEKFGTETGAGGEGAPEKEGGGGGKGGVFSRGLPPSPSSGILQWTYGMDFLLCFDTFGPT